MKKIVIFGNSSSGKSTLAKTLSSKEGLVHLDLDALAWLPTTPPQRKPLQESKLEIDEFINLNPSWVIEGCYSDLLDLALPSSNEIIFMNLPVEQCIENARSRPWEPHKYGSKEAQDKNLPMLIDWISQYAVRQDVFSKGSHENLYGNYQGEKTMITKRECLI